MSDCTQCADYEWCAKNEECGMFKQKQMTNADRIRAMSDAELAVWLYWKADGSGKTKDQWLDWLREEVKE